MTSWWRQAFDIEQAAPEKSGSFDAMGGHPVDARSRVDNRPDDVPDGINAADHAAGLSSSLDISPLPSNAERRLPRSTVGL
jgi:hypothetical protein